MTARVRAADPDPTAPAADDATAAAKGCWPRCGASRGLEPPAIGRRSDLTLALRDLAMLKNDLPAALQPAAERLLARPHRRRR